MMVVFFKSYKDKLFGGIIQIPFPIKRLTQWQFNGLSGDVPSRPATARKGS